MMQYPEKTTNELYQNLGRLFYSVAMSDNSVHTREIDKLRSFIRKFWLDVDEVEDEDASQTSSSKSNRDVIEKRN